MSATLSYWLAIDITFISKSDLSTKTLRFTNKALLGYNSGTNYPLAIAGASIGTASDRESILQDSGSIKLSNGIGSFGVDRKISDLLDRYEIIGQDITIYFGSSEIDSLEPDSFSAVFQGKVLDWSNLIDDAQPVIDIRFDSRKFKKRIINRIIDNVLFSAAPNSSIGKSIPLVFGNADVRPIGITADGRNDARSWAYATTLADEHSVEGIFGYYAKDPYGVYQLQRSAVATATAVFSESGTSSTSSITNLEAAFKFKAASETTRNYIITQVKVTFDGDGAASVHDGTITCNIYEATNVPVGGSSTPCPDKLRASGVVQAADYDASFDAAPDFDITFELNTPLIIDPAKCYYIAFVHKPNLGAGTCNLRYAASGSTPTWVRSSTTGWITDGTSKVCNFSAYGVKFTDSNTGAATADVNGLGVAYYTAEKQTPPTGAGHCALSNLDMVVNVVGLRDDSSGTITGSASSVIYRPEYAIKCMAQTWNGTAWSLSSDWDFSTYSDTYFRDYEIYGGWDTETTFEQWTRSVCRSIGGTIVYLNSGKLALYIWGTTRTSAATLTQENSRITRLESLDQSYVINDVKIAHTKRLIYFDSLTLARQGINADFTVLTQLNESTSAEYATLIGQSINLYGRRELNDIYFPYLIANPTLGLVDMPTRIARYYLANFNQPPKIVELEAPYSDFRTLEIKSLVTIINPSLPNYYGGIPNAKLPNYLGEEVDVNAGYNLCEAAQYRAQIEGKTLTFNENAAPTLNLTCRLLTNYPNDPT